MRKSNEIKREIFNIFVDNKCIQLRKVFPFDINSQMFFFSGGKYKMD